MNYRSKAPIDLGSLSRELGADLSGPGTAAVTSVTHDSRQTTEGAVFVAIKGATIDGHRFVDDVVRRGAVGIISEMDAPRDLASSWLKVPDARRALAKAAAEVYHNPSHDLELIGITGTNGKTTTTYLCRALAEAAGKRSAMLTTVEYRIDGESRPAVRTTPEASDTNHFLRDAADKGCSVAVMEASSQAIDLHRCDWLRFRAVVFTNLTRDHLDYHQTMERYFDAKKRLFDGRLGEAPGASVINIDDEWGMVLASELASSGKKVLTFSQRSADSAGIQSSGHFYAENVSVSLLKGTSFSLSTPHGAIQAASPLVGRPHVYNMLAASAVAVELGYTLGSIRQGLASCTGAPGRFERVESGTDIAVVVDYAHTDDALLNTLKTARELTEGRIITVFGCGGDRDRTKRAPMGQIAGENSDLVILTSDNPRTEDPLEIIDEIKLGLESTAAEFRTVPDRREAIYQAVGAARPGDVVVIAGKGHETYQIIGNDKFDFDDKKVAAEAITALSEH